MLFSIIIFPRIWESEVVTSTLAFCTVTQRVRNTAELFSMGFMEEREPRNRTGAYSPHRNP